MFSTSEWPQDRRITVRDLQAATERGERSIPSLRAVT
jgi:hypothetical protein